MSNVCLEKSAGWGGRHKEEESFTKKIGFALDVDYRDDSSYFVLLRVFRAIRGSVLMLLKNDPRIARNTRNNTKRVEPTLKGKAKKISTLNKQTMDLLEKKTSRVSASAGLVC